MILINKKKYMNLIEFDRRIDDMLNIQQNKPIIALEKIFITIWS